MPVTPRAAKICNHCANVQPCPAHPKEPWAGSTRAQRITLSGSAQQARRRRIIDRDRGICHVCGKPGANQADHKVPLAEGGADTDDNMGAIHSDPCHKAKSSEEARRGRQRTQGGGDHE